ncbi:MAG: 3' terminal RNA ribose 2'-O-methyltransferase Hen1 [Pirellulaceae bacterium]|nr:3' terminal RNA ribose 2'-O-methyltransferase Hen1 [Pirellulaceae bacterium]
MLLTLTTTHRPATDLGYLLHKNPTRCQSFSLSFGSAHVFYPETAEDRCTAALLLDVDPVAMVRGRSGLTQTVLAQYVNDRPYVASSFMSVAIAQVLGPALDGRSKERPELAKTPIPLVANIEVLPCRGGEDFLHEVFTPLGYEIEAVRYPLDETFPDWGPSPYYSVTLSKTTTLGELLTHLYVLIPVFDNFKHYYVGQEELNKLLKQGEGWLASHPKREVIVRRYLKHRPSLARQAIERLVEQDDQPLEDFLAEPRSEGREESLEKPMSLNDQRLDTVAAALKASGAKRVLDLGCGEGRLLRELLKDKQFEEIVGMDVSIRSLEIATARLRMDDLPPRQRERIRLLHGSLMYRDKRLSGFDAAAVVEVVEHLDPPRLAAFERVLFEFARPTMIVLTTPNREYNVTWPNLAAGAFRHEDHRFEWTREEYQNWATGVAERFGYTVEFRPVGPENAEFGPPTQMAVFNLGQHDNK